MQPPGDDIEYHILRHIVPHFPPSSDGRRIELAARLFIRRLLRYLRGSNHPKSAKGKSVERDADSVESRRTMFRAELFLRFASGCAGIPLEPFKIAVHYHRQLHPLYASHISIQVFFQWAPQDRYLAVSAFSNLPNLFTERRLGSKVQHLL